MNRVQAGETDRGPLSDGGPEHLPVGEQVEIHYKNILWGIRFSLGAGYLNRFLPATRE